MCAARTNAVGERELERALAERLGHGQRGDQERRHRGEHDEAHRALLGIDDARQPRVSGPGPPQQRQHHHALGDPLPGGVLDHQRGALGQREDEDEVEEELERSHPLALAHHGAQPVFRGLRMRFHAPIIADRASRSTMLERAGLDTVTLD